jgi:hypothetical protein
MSWADRENFLDLHFTSRNFVTAEFSLKKHFFFTLEISWSLWTKYNHKGATLIIYLSFKTNLPSHHTTEIHISSKYEENLNNSIFSGQIYVIDLS